MNIQQKEKNYFNFKGGQIIGKSEKIHKVFNLIEMVAKTEATVLIQGDSGTGKELVANAIHSISLRSHGPFIKVNCAALAEPLLESELFGYKKGAFTGAFQEKKGLFEVANGGTILLDEIGNMSLGGQAKLLRVLQEGEIVPVGGSRPVKVDVRVVVTTNIYLAEAMQTGTFREDLFYRLQVVTFNIPPLRERREDIHLLAHHFINKYSSKNHRPIKGISPAALRILEQYEWPGNIRELEHVIERAVIMEAAEHIQPQTLPFNILQNKEPAKYQTELTLRQKINLFERQQIVLALNDAGWKRNVAAQKLGIDQRNLNYFLKKHHITNPKFELKPGLSVS